MVPAASTRPVTTADLAASMVTRRGMAVMVVRVMPVLYSPLMASTAMMATTAWPRSVPVRLILAGSTLHPPDGQVVAEVAAALTATVRRMGAASSQGVPGRVRSLVHSA